MRSNATDPPFGPRRPAGPVHRAYGFAGALRDGALLGAAIGVLEVLLQIAFVASAVTRHFLLEAAFLYALVGLAGGGFCWILLRLLARRSPSSSAVHALLIPAMLFLVIGTYVNVYFLPKAMSSRSLIDEERPLYFDLASDPGETRKLQADEAGTAGAEADSLMEVMARFREAASLQAVAGVVVDEAPRERLKALGYLL